MGPDFSDPQLPPPPVPPRMPSAPRPGAPPPPPPVVHYVAPPPPPLTGMSATGMTLDQMPAVAPISKTLYMGLIIGGAAGGTIIYGLSFVFLIFGTSSTQPSASFVLLPVLGLFVGVAGWLLSWVAWLVLLGRGWGAIQDGNARMTPGKAVGLSLIPFFNLYWVFPSVYGLAQDFNTFAEQQRLPIIRLNDGLYIAYGVCKVATLIAGWLAMLAMVVLSAIICSELCDAINEVSAAQSAASYGPATPMPPPRY